MASSSSTSVPLVVGSSGVVPTSPLVSREAKQLQQQQQQQQQRIQPQTQQQVPGGQRSWRLRETADALLQERQQHLATQPIESLAIPAVGSGTTNTAVMHYHTSFDTTAQWEDTLDLTVVQKAFATAARGVVDALRRQAWERQKQAEAAGGDFLYASPTKQTYDNDDDTLARTPMPDPADLPVALRVRCTDVPAARRAALQRALANKAVVAAVPPLRGTETGQSGTVCRTGGFQ
jgi:hypothetical protein